MEHSRSYRNNTTVRLALVVIALVMLSAASMLLILHQTNQAAARRDLLGQLSTQADLLSHQLEFYQQIVEDMARRTQVRDLLNVGSAQDAHQWAVQRREALPNSIGLALINLDGEVLGDPSDLRVGSSCVDDLERHPFAANREVLEAALGLGPPHAGRGHLHLTHGVTLGPVFAHRSQLRR